MFVLDVFIFFKSSFILFFSSILNKKIYLKTDHVSELRKFNRIYNNWACTHTYKTEQNKFHTHNLNQYKNLFFRIQNKQLNSWFMVISFKSLTVLKVSRKKWELLSKHQFFSQLRYCQPTEHMFVTLLLASEAKTALTSWFLLPPLFHFYNELRTVCLGIQKTIHSGYSCNIHYMDLHLKNLKKP